MEFAIAQADRRNAQAGITTVFHALSFAHGELGVRNRNMAAGIARQVHIYSQVMVDNRIHGRYEITDEESLPILSDLIEEGALGLISMMDHTPGQGQFKDLAACRDYLGRTYAKSADEAKALIRKKFDSAQGACERIKMLVQKAQKAGIRVASHDDDSPESVQTMSALGRTVSEFPVNRRAAQTACDLGLWTVFGVPNILRGCSQSGSMKALEAVQHGAARCLCSDYHPGALLAAVFRLPRLAGIELANAARLVTANPALAAGLDLLSLDDAYARLHRKLLSGYAMDALLHPQDGPPQDARAAAEAFLNALASCESEPYESVGLGRDCRIRGAEAVGSALIYRDRVIHMVAFRSGDGREAAGDGGFIRRFRL